MMGIALVLVVEAERVEGLEFGVGLMFLWIEGVGKRVSYHNLFHDVG